LWQKLQAGNILTYPNAANEIQGIADHDQNGNMTVMPVMKAKYDAWNRLVEVKDSSDALLANYEYNGLNHRVKKTVGDVVTMSFFNKQWQELDTAIVQPSGEGEIMTYIWGTRYIDDLVLRERDGEPLYSLADPNWNVVAVTDDSGTVQERMKYDAFGKVTWMGAGFATKANSDLAWNRTFTGQVLDAETGLMLYRNRFYHTGLGRFVQRDQVGYDAKDMNLYRYISNNTMRYLDPSGNGVIKDRQEQLQNDLDAKKDNLLGKDGGVLCDKSKCLADAELEKGKCRGRAIRYNLAAGPLIAATCAAACLKWVLPKAIGICSAACIAAGAAVGVADLFRAFAACDKQYQYAIAQC